MRLPIILALIVVITLPKDIHGLVDGLSSQLTSATVAVGKMLKHDDSIQVAEAKVLKLQNVSKGQAQNLR